MKYSGNYGLLKGYLLFAYGIPHQYSTELRTKSYQQILSLGSEAKYLPPQHANTRLVRTLGSAVLLFPSLKA